MSDNTKIEWTDSTWNPIRGCSLVSDGCKNCYAMGVAGRFSGPGQLYDGLTTKTTQGPKWTGKIMLVPHMLTQPIKWQRSRKIFVNSMSDLFHEDVPDSYIDQVFAVMALAPQHIFQVLTKRPERMRDYCTDFSWSRVIDSSTGADGVSTLSGFTLQALAHHFGQVPLSTLNYKRRDVWPLRNVWFGVSVEDQAAANERIPLLLETPAAVRWLSMEPLLGPVDLTEAFLKNKLGGRYPFPGLPNEHRTKLVDLIDWVVVGGESGAKARPMNPNWASTLRDQCAAADVPFLFKQWGEWAPANKRGDQIVVVGETDFSKQPLFHEFTDGEMLARIGKKAAGRTLDGKLHDGYPAEITE